MGRGQFTNCEVLEFVVWTGHFLISDHGYLENKPGQTFLLLFPSYDVYNMSYTIVESRRTGQERNVGQGFFFTSAHWLISALVFGQHLYIQQQGRL